MEASTMGCGARLLRLTGLLLLLAAAPLAAQAVPVADVPLGAEAARSAASVRAEHAIPGLSVAIRHADGRVAAAGFGLADVENDVPVTERTVFRLASISKPVTAVVAMRLAARGVLDLDQPVHEVVPEFPERRWPVTTRQLLSHLGGVRHYQGREEIRSNRHYPGVVEGLRVFARDPLIHEPGSRYRYTTYGFNLAGAACVRASGSSFRELLALEVHALVPGTEALQFDDQGRIIRHRAQGYRMVDGELQNSAPVDTSNKVPGGGLCSTAAALVRFAGAVADGTLLDEDSRRAMWTEQETLDGDGIGYGLGWSVPEPDGEGPRQVGHGGAQPRVSTYLWLAPEHGVAVAVFANLEGQGGAVSGLARRLGTAACR